jgi:glutathione S-transferase
MSTLEFVEVATARSAPGVKLVVSGLVPSPWSEAAKGIFKLAEIPVFAVRRMRDGAEITEWTGVDNVPVVVYDAEPARAHWAAITTLAARLAGPDVVIPKEVAARAETMGLLHELAGEEGLGWNARLVMIHGSLTTAGARGFPLQVGERLAKRYGYTPEEMPFIRGRVEQQLQLMHTRLREQRALGHSYLGGARASALDIYLATFLTPLSEITVNDCPELAPALRQAFGCAHEALGALVPAELAAHRKMMFERHLTWPIVL